MSIDIKKAWWMMAGGGSVVLPISSGAEAIWGVVNMVDGYSGAAIRIKRSSDSAETDINFLSTSIGSRLSKAQIDTFTSNGSISATVVTIYDQANSWDLLVEAARDAATLYYDSGYNNYCLKWGSGDTVSYQIPVGLTISTQNVSLYNMVMGRKGTTGIEAYWDWGTNNLLYYQNDYNSRAIYDGSAEIFSSKNIFNTVDVNIHSIRASASNVKKNVDNLTSGTAAALTSTNPAGGRIGRWTGGATFWARYNWFGGIVYKSVLSDGVDTSNVTALQSYFSKTVNYSKLVVCLGDSITESRNAGDSLNLNANWPVLIKRQFTDSIRFVNSGYSGNTLVQINTDRAPRATDLIALGSYTNKVAIVWAGTNDINAGTSGATAHTSLQTLCNNLSSGGFDKIIVVDIIPRGPFSGAQNTEKDAFNTLVAANWATYADAFVQASSLSWVYGTHYAADQIHPNTAGNALVEPLIKTAIDSVI